MMSVGGMWGRLILLVAPWLCPASYGPDNSAVQLLLAWWGICICWLCFEYFDISYENRIREIAFAWLLAAIGSAGVGIIQYLGFSADGGYWVSYAEPGQAYGNLRQRNHLASLISIGLSVLLFWKGSLVANSKRVRSSLFVNSVKGSIAALLAVADAATGSRTGLLQLLSLVGLCAVWRRERTTLIFAIFFYLAAALILPVLINRTPMQSGILGRIDESVLPCSSRFILWSNVLNLIAQKPWMGWGWGELKYAHFTTLYSGDRFCEILGNAHNLPLHLAVELGVPFALLVSFMTVRVTIRAKPWREQCDRRQMAWSVLSVVGIHSLLEYPLWYGPFQVATLLAIWSLCRSGAHKNVVLKALIKVPPNLIVAEVLCTIAVVGYVSWDYWRISQIYLPTPDRAVIYRNHTLEKIQGSRLFKAEVEFAELSVTPLTSGNAAHIHALAAKMLHFSPEVSVVEKLIESALIIGKDEESRYYEQCYQAAYPTYYIHWKQGNSLNTGYKVP